MPRGHDCHFLGTYLTPFTESKQTQNKYFTRFNQDHCLWKSDGTVWCMELSVTAMR